VRDSTEGCGREASELSGRSGSAKKQNKKSIWLVGGPGSSYSKTKNLRGVKEKSSGRKKRGCGNAKRRNKKKGLIPVQGSGAGRYLKDACKGSLEGKKPSGKKRKKGEKTPRPRLSSKGDTKKKGKEAKRSGRVAKRGKKRDIQYKGFLGRHVVPSEFHERRGKKIHAEEKRRKKG